MSLPPGPLTEHERRLFARVQQWTPAPAWSELSQKTLAEIANREGIDFATALLYRCLRQSAEHGAGIAFLESGTSQTMRDWLAGNPNLSVGIVPGGCHEESVDSRAAVGLVHDQVVQLGLPAQLSRGR